MSEESIKILFRANLPNINSSSSGANELSISSLVRLCFSEIQGAKKEGYSWQEIAETLQVVAAEKFQKEMTISGSAVKRIFYRVSRSQKLKKHRPSSKAKAKSNVESNPKAACQEYSQVATESPLMDLASELAEESEPEPISESMNSLNSAQRGKKEDKDQKNRFNFPKREGAPVLRAFGSSLK